MKEILIVEDNSTIRQSLNHLLMLEGFHPKTASNGREALDMLEEGYKPKLIILDWMLPVMDGGEFLTLFQKMEGHKETSVLVLSGDGRIEQKIRPYDVVATLIKPIDVDLLLSHIRKYC